MKAAGPFWAGSLPSGGGGCQRRAAQRSGIIGNKRSAAQRWGHGPAGSAAHHHVEEDVGWPGVQEDGRQQPPCLARQDALVVLHVQHSARAGHRVWGGADRGSKWATAELNCQGVQQNASQCICKTTAAYLQPPGRQPALCDQLQRKGGGVEQQQQVGAFAAGVANPVGTLCPLPPAPAGVERCRAAGASGRLGPLGVGPPPPPPKAQTPGFDRTWPPAAPPAGLPRTPPPPPHGSAAAASGPADGAMPLRRCSGPPPRPWQSARRWDHTASQCTWALPCTPMIGVL